MRCSRKARFIDFMLMIIKTILYDGAVALRASMIFWKGLGGSKPWYDSRRKISAWIENPALSAGLQPPRTLCWRMYWTELMLIFNMRRSEHITDALISLRCLRVPERIVFKVATLTFRALHGTAPPYMTSQFTRVADMSNWQRLRSASSNQLDVPSFRLPTVGSRAFPIAGAKVWNSLPDDVTSALSVSTFPRHLKTYLFRCCYNTDWYCSYLLWL